MLTGVLSAAAAIGTSHLVAAFTMPSASPLIAVGSTLIDAAPTPAKEFAVRQFGTYDKPILISGIGLALLVLASLIGLLAWRHRRLALSAIGALGVVGVIAVVIGPGAGWRGLLPSVVAGVVGAGALWGLTAVWSRRSSAGLADPSAAMTEANRRRARRGFLLGLGATGALAAATGTSGALAARSRPGGAGSSRLPLPTPTSAAAPIPSGAQVPGNTGFLTSIADFYRVDISLVTPRVPAEDWTLTIDGMVDRPITLSYADLLALPMIERTMTLTCVSNEVGGRYVGNARWLGVPFAEIIERIGVQPGVDQVFSYSTDSGYTCSTPYRAVSDGRDAMIVVGMNGEVLPDKNGFPARMFVPGLFGFVSATKWLKRLEFTTYARRTAYWTERKWATDAPILTQSRIDVPKSLTTLPKDKPVLAGVAWAQHRGIGKVEIRIDNGPWRDARLADDAGIDVWRQWTYVYDGAPGQHTAEVRATDLTGVVQPEGRTKVFPDGARGWHQIVFTAPT